MSTHTTEHSSEEDGRLFAAMIKKAVSAEAEADMLNYVIEGIGRNISADRCYIYFFRDLESGSSIADNVYEWYAEGIRPEIDGQQGCDMAGLPDFLAAIAAGTLYAFTDITKIHPQSRSWLEPQGIQSLIAAPLVGHKGKVKGFVGFDFVRHAVPEFSQRVITNIQEAADIIAVCKRLANERYLARQAQHVLADSGVGLWSIEEEDGQQPRMYGDKVMFDLLGCAGEKLTPEECYNFWYDHIHPDYYNEVRRVVEHMKAGVYSEVQYPYLHPTRGEIWVRCGGHVDTEFTRGTRCVGRLRDVTEMVTVEKENAEQLQSARQLAAMISDRVDKQNCINASLEVLMAEPDFEAALEQILTMWGEKLKAQWCYLGEFGDGQYKLHYSYAAPGVRPAFNSYESYTYVTELNEGESFHGKSDVLAFPDFATMPIREEIAVTAACPESMRKMESFYCHLIRFEGRPWGTLDIAFDKRHEMTANEMLLFKTAAKNVQLALMRHKIQQRLQSERDRAISAERAQKLFFSCVSHDIRTPLNAIIGLSDLLTKTGDDPAVRVKYLEAIQSSGKMLSQLVNDVLDLSKLDTGLLELVTEPTDVAGVIHEVAKTFDLVRETKPVSLIEDIGELPYLQLDPQRLRQLLFNLLSNAFKFTERGSVTVKATWQDEDLFVSVADTGIGISQDDIARVLQPFVQVLDRNHRNGTGLGLPICKRLAELMGGELLITSEKGKGSVFTIHLKKPRVTTPASLQEGTEVETEPVIPKDYHVLIVDDSSVNLLVLKEMLARCGIKKVTKAANGADALALLRNDPSINLVLTDYWMPQMDGAQLMHAVRADIALHSLPVVLITADVEAVPKFKASGFTDVILKPVRHMALKAILNRITTECK